MPSGYPRIHWIEYPDLTVSLTDGLIDTGPTYTIRWYETDGRLHAEPANVYPDLKLKAIVSGSKPGYKKLVQLQEALTQREG